MYVHVLSYVLILSVCMDVWGHRVQYCTNTVTYRQQATLVTLPVQRTATCQPLGASGEARYRMVPCCACVYVYVYGRICITSWGRLATPRRAPRAVPSSLRSPRLCPMIEAVRCTCTCHSAQDSLTSNATGARQLYRHVDSHQMACPPCPSSGVSHAPALLCMYLSFTRPKALAMSHES